MQHVGETGKTIGGGNQHLESRQIYYRLSGLRFGNSELRGECLVIKRLSAMLVCCSLVLVMMFGCTVQGSQAQAKFTMEISAGNLGAALHAFASGWAKIINSKTPVQATVVATGGSLENLRRLGSKDADIGYLVTPQLAEAYQGVGDFKKETKQDYTGIRGLYAYNLGGLNFTVCEESGIKTISDLRGKKVVLGAPGSTGAVYLEKILASHGLRKGADYRAEYLTASAGATALQDGAVHCLGLLVPVPIAAVMDISMHKTVRLLPLDEEGMAAFMAENPGWEKGFFDPSVYKNVASKDPVPGLFTTITVASHKDVSEEMIYEVVKALWENIDEFHLCHAIAPDVTLDTAFRTMSVPLHSGAVKYYREKGIDIPQDLLP